MQLYLVRHGETEYNRRRIALGRADVPLNKLGRRQAEQLAQRLRAMRLEAVYASPLSRALVTAQAIAVEHGLDVHLEQGLIEMDIGEAEGLTGPQMSERFPAIAQNWGGPDGPTTRIPGSEECLVDVQQRAWETVRRIADLHEAGVVCAVTHNFVILSVLARALEIDIVNFRRLRHGLAAIAVIQITERRTRVIRMNDVCHLG